MQDVPEKDDPPPSELPALGRAGDGEAGDGEADGHGEGDEVEATVRPSEPSVSVTSVTDEDAATTAPGTAAATAFACASSPFG
jgi:hypothetical protein